MGKKKDYSGKWQGQYTYGPGYGERLRGTSDVFTLDITVDRKGRFDGSFVEPERPGVGSLTGRVEGKIEDVEIEFIKVYSVYFGLVADGSYAVDTGREPVEVHYYGKLNGEVFQGNWKIFYSIIRKNGETDVWISEGTWSMGRG